MNLNGFVNLDYVHHSGDVYTLLCVGDTFHPTDVEGEYTRVPHAVYRKHATGEIFIRPMNEFEQKFEQHTVELETVLDEDMAMLQNHIEETERFFNKRRITILGMARALWTLFPMVSLDVRIGLIRALNFCDFIPNLSDELLAERLTERYIKLSKHLHNSGASVTATDPNATMQMFDHASSEEALALLMLGLASSCREYTLLSTMTNIEGEESEQQKRLNEIQVLVESIQATAKWMTDTGITVALPPLKVKASFGDDAYVAETDPK